jgi:predicted RNase H-like HicB family nuclease
MNNLNAKLAAMKSYVFKVELEEEDGVWSAVVPAMPGCAVDADSPEEALEAIRELAQIFVESLLEDGRPIPLDEVKSGIDGAAVAVVA